MQQVSIIAILLPGDSSNFQINMKILIPSIILILSIFLVHAETTFFDNPDDFFIMNSAAGSSGATGTASGTAGGCIYKWNCTNWGECLQSGKQIRNCINIGSCSNTYKTPETEQNCTYAAQKPEQNETEEIIKKEIAEKNRILICSVIILAILSVIFYLEKNYFKKLIKK